MDLHGDLFVDTDVKGMYKVQYLYLFSVWNTILFSTRDIHNEFFLVVGDAWLLGVLKLLNLCFSSQNPAVPFVSKTNTVIELPQGFLRSKRENRIGGCTSILDENLVFTRRRSQLGICTGCA